MDYKEKFKLVTDIVNEVDPDGLIQGGAPLDDYGSEVASVLVAMQHSTNEDELVERLKKIFTEPTNPEAYTSLAAKLRQIH